MRRIILVLASIGVAVLLASGVALGITNGHPDDGEHPNVGALVDQFDGETYPYCTGTLISNSPTESPGDTEAILLTAAHCYPETKNHFYVTFEEKPTSVMSQDQGLTGTFHADPNLDIAVVKFAQPVRDESDSLITPAKLPTLGQVADTAKATNKFTAVGYGGELAPKEPGGPLIVYGDQREWAVSTFKSFNGTYLRLSQNQGSGGTCYGDSGGPNFFGAGTAETNVIAGITITGDTWCKATNVTLRLDTKPVRDFLIEQGVTPP